MSNKESVLTIDAPHFNAGVVLADGWVIRAAPILKYMIGWTHQRVVNYAAGKGWTVLAASGETPE